MRGKVLCILKGGTCARIHQYYSELRKFCDGQVSVSHFCKTPFLGGMEINIIIFYITCICENAFLFMYVVCKYLHENGKNITTG